MKRWLYTWISPNGQYQNQIDSIPCSWRQKSCIQSAKRRPGAPKNWCSRTVVLEKTLESPLDCKEIKPINPKRNQPWTFTGRTDAEAETPILLPPDMNSWLTGKDFLSPGKIESRTTAWWRVRWLDSITDSLGQTPGDGEGQGSLVCCSPWGHEKVRHHLVTKHHHLFSRWPHPPSPLCSCPSPETMASLISLCDNGLFYLEWSSPGYPLGFLNPFKNLMGPKQTTYLKSHPHLHSAALTLPHSALFLWWHHDLLIHYIVFLFYVYFSASSSRM